MSELMNRYALDLVRTKKAMACSSVNLSDDEVDYLANIMFGNPGSAEAVVKKIASEDTVLRYVPRSDKSLRYEIMENVYILRNKFRFILGVDVEAKSIALSRACMELLHIQYDPVPLVDAFTASDEISIAGVPVHAYVQDGPESINQNVLAYFYSIAWHVPE